MAGNSSYKYAKGPILRSTEYKEYVDENGQIQHEVML